MTETKVSIIVISHRRKLLSECIESIERQTYNNIEVLIHHTLAAPHKQMYDVKKVNRLVDASIGQYVSIICEDDEYEPTFVEKCVNAITNENVDLVYTDRLTIGDAVKYLPSREFSINSFKSSPSTPIPGTVLFSRNSWDIVGGYTSKNFADSHFLWKLCKSGFKAYHLEEPLFLYRIHLENRSLKDDLNTMMIEYYRENKELAEGLNPNDPSINEIQAGFVKRILTDIYGDQCKWPKNRAPLLAEQKKEILL